MTQRYNLESLAAYYKGKKIAIMGNGPSVIFTDSRGQRAGKADFSQYKYPIWAVNGGWHYHPNTALGFQMDDIKGPAILDHPTPDWYVGLVQNSTIPIITSKEYPDYPTTLAYPLEDIIRFHGLAYFAESINYMLALAIMWGVSEIDFFGCDYNPERAHERASTEFWCGMARQSGIKLNVPPNSALLKAVHEEPFYMPGFYGYSRKTFPLDWDEGPYGGVNIKIPEKAKADGPDVQEEVLPAYTESPQEALAV